MKTVLYIHGMGGGGDSRIPRLLREHFAGSDVRIVVRTYDFDPEKGRAQIAAWAEELRPDLVVGESLGSIQAIRVQGVPHLHVSPALGAPRRLSRMAWVALLPGGPALLHRLWPDREGDRQPIRFEYKVLRKYRHHWEEACRAAACGDYHFAFFGKHDHYKRSGIVKISTWRKMFGDTFQEYDGTHFMEEEFVHSLLIPAICRCLGE